MAIILTIVDSAMHYWYAFILLGVVTFFWSPAGKGLVGEAIVHIMARFFLNSREYYLFKNVTIPVKGGTTQIDHVIVSKYGVFVIETKNMKGWIYGGENHPLWTQKIYSHSHSFQNPLRQNFKHTKGLADCIGIAHSKIFSVIVFTGESHFKTVMPENVTCGRQFIKYIKSQRIPLFGEYEVGEVIQRLEERCLKKSLKTNRDHIRYVNYSHSSKKGKISFGRLFFRSTTLFITVGGACGLLLALIYFDRSGYNASNVVMENIEKVKGIFSLHSDSQNTTSSSTDGEKTTIQIRDAVESLLENRQAEFIQKSGAVKSNTVPSYLYEIELLSGGWVYSDNVLVEGQTVTYTGSNGVIVSLLKDEIKTVKRVRVDK